MDWDGGVLNRELFEEQYERYLKDPKNVDPSWKKLFDAPLAQQDKGSRRDLYLELGHLFAKFNPLKVKSVQSGALGSDQHLEKSYCGRIGYEFSHVEDSALKEWLRERIESTESTPNLPIETKKMLLDELNRASLFESFLQTKYVGQKRFSLEGGETLIPMLKELILRSSSLGAFECFIGMAHRGRLNVLSNILEKAHSQIFSEFEEHYVPDELEGSGDVKYHKGFTSELTLQNKKRMRILLAPNPSHLESVNPVVTGEVRARQEQLKSQEAVLPILVHGDAALAGQGVIYETLQMSKLPGYTVGGTIHVVINNQIGFTTLPEEGRSTRYCTDIAKTFGYPVFHVNAEDPEACIFVSTLAAEIRREFKVDVFIDLVSYRKYGHNESDEPAFTQPLEYQEIRKKQSIRELYRDQLLSEGVVEKNLAESLERRFKEGLQKVLEELREKPVKPAPQVKIQKEPPRTLFESVKTSVSFEEIREVMDALSKIPDGFTLHPKLLHLIESRQKQTESEKGEVDWGTAEALAFGTLLKEGTPVRLSGQDSGRGTFSHRLSIWVDQVREKSYIPLQSIGNFSVYNSPLSELAVLGFEYGYSVVSPKSLNLWEAQFGDFANGAQVIIDQYISTSEMKWGQKSNLVMLLPHGYEGQGPEHSSGRMERFLVLSAQENLIIANVTTPAQLFHLLRRQMKKPFQIPLILFTPKGLLRYPDCISSVSDLTTGGFQEIISEGSREAKRLLFCSGRIYYDLIKEREKRGGDFSIIRIEQLYPLDMRRLKELIAEFPEVTRWFWVQEEPSNMGAWKFLRFKLQKLLPKGAVIDYIGRERSASPATGSHRIHDAEYEEIMRAIYEQ